MTPLAIYYCKYAIGDIRNGDYQNAIEQIRLALPMVTNARAKSKLMLAIRELKRAIN